MSELRIGSLCSGYGGLDGAAQALTGGTVAWFCEKGEDPSKILAHHWPDIPNHRDITTTDWSTVEPVDVLTAGFPCQDVSHAGKRAGLRPGTRTGIWSNVAEAIAPYEPAILRWQRVLGRPAPRPTEPGRNGNPRLSPRFVEWMQGLDDGHVTAVPGLSRNAQLAALGNGVVVQQAVAAYRLLLSALISECAA